MTDRGDYRAIRRVLLDGKDFRRLSERARWLFVALKLNFGPAGIETWEPMALVYTLAAQTGIPADAVERALDELAAAGWVQREDNVLWIVGQLAHDPHVKHKDEKHRKSVQRHVSGLPTLGIVARYIDAHPAWFPAEADELRRGFEGVARGAPDPFEGPSKALRSTENKTENREPSTEEPSLGADAPETAADTSVPDDERQRTEAERVAITTVIEHYQALHPRTRPDSEANRAKVRARLREGYTVDDLCEAIDGNAADEWHRRVKKHEIPYVLRNANEVDRFRGLYADQQAARGGTATGTASAPADATTDPATLWNLGRDYQLCSYPGNRDEYDRRIAKAAADPRVTDPAGFAGAVYRVKLWELGTVQEERWAHKAIRERLHGPQGGAA